MSKHDINNYLLIVLIASTASLRAQSNRDIEYAGSYNWHRNEKLPAVSPNASHSDLVCDFSADSLLFVDDFNTNTIDTSKWYLGINAGSRPVVANSTLELHSQGSETGWVITRNAYPARHSIITVKVQQPNDDGDVGISPTYTLTSRFGIYNEPNWYRFYTYRDQPSGPYRLFVQWKKNGVEGGFDVTGNIVINGTIYLQLRLSDRNIHFEASLDGISWTETYSEAFSLPGYNLDDEYHYELAGYRTTQYGALVVDDFLIQTINPNPSTKEQIVLTDPLTQSTLGQRNGGQFVPSGGWQVTGADDMIVYDLGRYVETGSLELEVRNFRPSEQNTSPRHHFLSMFRNPWGNHHPLENLETVWDLHAGFYYDPGVKMLSWTYDENEEMNTIDRADWDRARTYHLKVVWNGNKLYYFREGLLSATHTHSAPMQLRYLFLGRDLTISADLVTGFRNNQYPAMTGPIYSNLIVKEIVSALDSLPPQVENVLASELYANGARLTWTTNEPTVCYVEYGLTDQYGQHTSVLGPPAQVHATAIANLTPNQTYHYRIVATDDAGNVTTSLDQTFTTLPNGIYLFKPVADTYVEGPGLYGTTRHYGNFGWMNLLVSANREDYLRFQIDGVAGIIEQARLRLHGRQSGNGRVAVHTLDTNWDEHNLTWLNKPSVTGKELGAIDSIRAGEWREVMLDSTVVLGNGTYNFALLGSGADEISLDSRESENAHPEVIVKARAGDIKPPVNLKFIDDFNSGTLDLSKWRSGSNAGNQSAVANNALELRAQGAESGWVMTRNAYVGRNTTITVKVLQPNDDGDLGMSPTYTLSSTTGIYSEPSWYRFYTYRSSPSGAYRLYVQWKKNGIVSGLDVTGNLIIAGAVYLRLRLDTRDIHFEASLDGATWIDTYTEPFSLPGYTPDNAFYYELAAYRTKQKGVLLVDDFSIISSLPNKPDTEPGLISQNEADLIPTAFALKNYPNPFHASTRIRLELPQAAEIQLAIFDLSGREVRQLLAAWFPAGSHETSWDGKTQEGNELSSGLYWLRLRYRPGKTDGWSQFVRRVMVVR